MPIHSDWGNWLPRAIADAEPRGLAVWFLGCNGFALKAADGTTLFIDPYLGTGDPPRTVRSIPIPFAPADVEAATAILATHEHSDHVHGPTQGPILANTGATFYGPDASIAVPTDEEWTDHWRIDSDQFVEVTEGETLALGSLTVNVEPAHDPDAVHPISYVIEHDSGTFYHGGDTKPDTVLESIGDRYSIDLGALAFGSVGMIPDKETRIPKRTKWYADENEVIEAAAALRLDRLLPSHWDMWRGLTASPAALRHHARSFEYPRRIDVVDLGDRVDL